jgi:protein PhnA
MSGDDDYVFDDETGEWMPASDLKARQAAAAQADLVVVRDCEGNVLSDGDQVIVVKDLPVKGTSHVVKRGTVIRSIRLTGDAQEVDCRHDTIKGLVLRAEYLRKRPG